MQTETTCKCREESENCQCKKCDCKAESPLLQEVYRTARMGIDSIEAVKKIDGGGPINDVINRQRAGYVKISDKAEKVAFDHSWELSPTPVMDKAMLWGGVMMNSLTDKSTSKLAEMLIQGTNMGIIALTKALNAYSEDENQDLANELLHQFNDNLTELKGLL